MIQLNLFMKQKQTHREWTYGCRERRMGGRDREFGINMYTLIYLIWITIKVLLYSRKFCSVLCGSLDGRGVEGRVDTCICVFTIPGGFPGSSAGKNLPAMQETLVDSWVRKICWRDRLPTPVFLGFPGGSAGKESVHNTGDLGSIPRLESPLEKETATHSSILA